MRFISSVALFTSLYCLNSFAGGFQLWEQDAASIGDYHAGAAGSANTAATEYYNPAGMVDLRYVEMSAGFAYIPLKINFNGVVGASPFGPITTGAQSKTNNYIPNFHVVYPVSSWLAFGSSTEYPVGNPIAAAATETKLQTINLNPSVAFMVGHFFSFAVGFDALYGKAIYDSAPVINNPPILITSSLDNKLQAWAFGWNAGVLFHINPFNRIGLSYRSKLQLKGEGTSTFNMAMTMPPFPTVVAPTLKSTTLSGVINLPPTTILSFYSDINRRLALMASLFYTQWSVFDELELKNVATSSGIQTIKMHENYKNSWNFSVGLHYWMIKQLMIKAGLGYDKTPTQPGFRDVRLPDANRFALAIGLHWQMISSLAIDAGWTHFFIQTAQVNNTQADVDLDPALMPLMQTVGRAKTCANVIGIQITWQPCR
jgi:long-chain fatty acid transport protein